MRPWQDIYVLLGGVCDSPVALRLMCGYSPSPRMGDPYVWDTSAPCGWKGVLTLQDVILSLFSPLWLETWQVEVCPGTDPLGGGIGGDTAAILLGLKLYNSFLFPFLHRYITLIAGSHHLISQAGWNRCDLSIYLSILSAPPSCYGERGKGNAKTSTHAGAIQACHFTEKPMLPSSDIASP